MTNKHMKHRIQAQFDHLAETHFNEFDFDLGERELGYALSFDHDLEMFAASVGLIKTSVDAIMKDEDVEVDLGELDAEVEFFSPLQKLIDLSRSAKVISKFVFSCFHRESQLNFSFPLGNSQNDSKTSPKNLQH